MKNLLKSNSVISLTLLILIFSITCNVQSIDSKSIPGKPDLSLGNSLLPEPTPTPELVNIADNFKLIAVYLIAKQPRALIKNLSIPEESAKEFQTGDFLDEYQTIQVSKISLNPTTRVELIDQNGYAYLIKPQSFDSKAATSKGGFGGKAAPTYFGGQAKSKQKKERDSASAEKPEKQDKTQTADGSPKKEEPLDKPSKPAVDTTSQIQAQQPTGTTSQALQPTITTTSASLSAPSAASQKAPPAPAQVLPQGQDGSDNRPVNPFGQ